MKFHFAYRGAKVLYDFLVSNNITGLFLLPANLCESVPDTFREAGCEIRYVDIDADTLCIAENEVLAQTKDCTGVFAVHTYGTERNFDSFFRQVRMIKRNVVIIDDRCLCMPDFEELDKYQQTEADLTLFSFGEKKQVQLGKGGVGFFKDKWLCKHVEMVDDAYFTNEQFTVNMEKFLFQKQIAKQHVAKMQTIYQTHLPLEIQLPMEYNNWRFHIRVPQTKKEQILQTLFANGLFASSHYKSLAENAEQNTPNAVKLQQEVINLFVDPKFYTEEQAIKTCQIINEIFQAK